MYVFHLGLVPQDPPQMQRLMYLMCSSSSARNWWRLRLPKLRVSLLRAEGPMLAKEIWSSRLLATVRHRRDARSLSSSRTVA